MMATISATLTAHAGDTETGGKYAFDGKISREVLENYLARSLNMLGLNWLRDNDPAGYLQMPGFACDGIIQPVAVGAATVTCYRANTRSKTSPHGFSQEETIKAIWSAVPGK